MDPGRTATGVGTQAYIPGKSTVPNPNTPAKYQYGTYTAPTTEQLSGLSSKANISAYYAAQANKASADIAQAKKDLAAAQKAGDISGMTAAQKAQSDALQRQAAIAKDQKQTLSQIGKTGYQTTEQIQTGKDTAAQTAFDKAISSAKLTSYTTPTNNTDVKTITTAAKTQANEAAAAQKAVDAAQKAGASQAKIAELQKVAAAQKAEADKAAADKAAADKAATDKAAADKAAAQKAAADKAAADKAARDKAAADKATAQKAAEEKAAADKAAAQKAAQEKAAAKKAADEKAAAEKAAAQKAAAEKTAAAKAAKAQTAAAKNPAKPMAKGGTVIVHKGMTSNLKKQLKNK